MNQHIMSLNTLQPPINTWRIQQHAKQLLLGLLLFACALLATAADDLTNGVIRRIDLANGKVTIKHEEIVSLDMPGMTMVFTLQDKTQAAQLAPGAAVRFRVSMQGSTMLITHIEPAQ